MKERRAYAIFLPTYIIGIAGFTHVVSGSVETLFLVSSGLIAWKEYFHFVIPTLLGNILGGIALVAIGNHAQVVAGGGHRKGERQ